MSCEAPPELGAVRPIELTIDWNALAFNLAQVRRLCGADIRVIAPVKADGLGAGAVALAKRLEALGVHALATGNFQDAAAIRAAGVKSKIIMFSSHLPEGSRTLMDYGLVPTVSSLDAARAVSQVASDAYPVYIKVDCGLGRLGVPLAEAESFVQSVARLPNVTVEGIYTHLPFFDEAGRQWAQRKMHEFRQMVERVARAGVRIPIAQSASSVGILSRMEHGLNAVAPMHLLFGLSPLPGERVARDMRLAFQGLKGRLIHVAHYGESAGEDLAGRFYGHTGRNLASVRRAGVLLLGIANGYGPVSHPDRAHVLIHGREAPVLGITAEYTVVDLSDIPAAGVGDEVVVFGRSDDAEMSLWDVADYLGLAPLQLLIALRDIPRIYL